MITSKLNTQDISIIESVMDIIEDNENAIEKNYNNKEDLVSLNKNLKDKIFSYMKNIHTDIDKKVLVKYAIRKYFALAQRDIVVIRTEQIIIKLLNYESIHVVTKEEEGTIASRYNGIKEDDLKSFYDDIFSQEDVDEFFHNIAETFVDKYMVQQSMDNKYYEQNVFPIIQLIIKSNLDENFDHNDDFFKGFAGYAFRIHFKSVFEYIAEIFLSELSEGSTYFLDFLKYYSLDVVIVNGVKYKVPAIKSSNGLKWNVASIRSIIKVFLNAEYTVAELSEKIDIKKEATSKFNIDEMSPVVYNSTIIRDIDQISQTINYETKRLDAYVESLKDNNNDAKLKKDIHDIKQKIQELKEEKILLQNDLVSRDIVLKYTDLKRELDAMVRQEQREQRVVKENEKSYLSIKEALIKALTSKKQAIN